MRMLLIVLLLSPTLIFAKTNFKLSVFQKEIIKDSVSKQSHRIAYMLNYHFYDHPKGNEIFYYNRGNRLGLSFSCFYKLNDFIYSGIGINHNYLKTHRTYSLMSNHLFFISKKKHRPFINMSFGYSLVKFTNEPYLNDNGTFCQFGLGYQFHFEKRSSLLFNIGVLGQDLTYKRKRHEVYLPTYILEKGFVWFPNLNLGFIF